MDTIRGLWSSATARARAAAGAVRDYVSEHRTGLGQLAGGAATVAMVPFAPWTAAAVATAAGTGYATRWAARRFLPPHPLQAAPAALAQVNQKLRLLTDGATPSVEERRAVYETLATALTSLRPTGEEIQLLRRFSDQLIALQPNATGQLQFTPEFRQTLGQVRPLLERFQSEQEGVLTHFSTAAQQFIRTLMQVGHVSHLSAYRALNDLETTAAPTAEQIATTRAHLAASMETFTARAETVPPALIEAAHALDEASPEALPSRERLQAAREALRNTIRTHSGLGTEILNQLFDAVFGADNGLLPRARTQADAYIEAFLRVPDAVFKAFHLVERLSYTTPIHRTPALIQEVQEALAAVNAPTQEIRNLLAALQGPVFDWAAMGPQLTSVHQQLKTRIETESGRAWQTLHQLERYIKDPQTGQLAALKGEILSWMAQAPVHLLEAHQALAAFAARPTEAPLQQAALTQLNLLREDPRFTPFYQDTAIHATIDDLHARLSAEPTQVDGDTPEMARQIGQALQTQAHQEEGAIRQGLNALIDSTTTRIQDFVVGATRDAISPLLRETRDQLRALQGRVNGNLLRTDLLAPLRENRTRIHTLRTHPDQIPLSHRAMLPGQLQALETVIDHYLDETPGTHLTELKTALGEGLNALDAPFGEENRGFLPRLLDRSTAALGESLTGLIQTTGTALGDQARRLIAQGRQMFTNAPDHPICGLFQALLAAHGPNPEQHDATVKRELLRVETYLPGFKAEITRQMGAGPLTQDPDRLLNVCMNELRALVSRSSPEQQGSFYEEVYLKARKDNPTDPTIGGLGWGERHAWNRDEIELSFYAFAVWHKKHFHYTKHPVYTFRQTALEARDTQDHARILASLHAVDEGLPGFSGRVLQKVYEKRNPGTVPFGWAEGHLADDVTCTLDAAWEVLQELVNAMGHGSPQERYFYRCAAELSPQGAHGENHEQWGERNSFDPAHKERDFATFAWYLTKIRDNGGALRDIGEMPPPGIVGAALGVGATMEAHPFFGPVMKMVASVPGLGLAGVTNMVADALRSSVTRFISGQQRGVTPAQRTALEGEIEAAIERLKQAHEQGTPAAYISALKAVYQSLTANRSIIINGLEFNFNTESGLRTTLEAEKRMLAELQHLDPNHSSEPDTPEAWHHRVNEELVKLQTNARYFSLYTLFYDGPLGVGIENPREQIDRRIRAGITAAPGTPAYADALEDGRRREGWYQATTRNEFHDWMSLVMAAPAEEQEAKFKEILFRKVKEKSVVKWMFLKCIYWLLNPWIKTQLNSTLPTSITAIREWVHKWQIEQGESKARPIPTEPMHRMSDALISIKEGFKAWGAQPTENRDAQVSKFVERPEFNHNMTTKQLQNETAKALLRASMPPAAHTYGDTAKSLFTWCSQDASTSHSFWNKFLIGVKAIFVGSWTIPLALIVVEPLQMMFGGLYRSAKLSVFEWAALKTNILSTALTNTQNALYDTSAYQLALNKVLCEQLEAVWQLIDPENQTPFQRAHSRLKTLREQTDLTQRDREETTRALHEAIQAYGAENLPIPQEIHAAMTAAGACTLPPDEAHKATFLAAINLLNTKVEADKARNPTSRFMEIAEQQPEATKTAIHALVEHLFSTLELRGIHDEAQMREKTSGAHGILARTQQQMRSLFMPDVVDNVVKLIMVGFQSVIEKDQMEQQMARLLELTNEAVTGISRDNEQLTAEEIRRRNDHYTRRTQATMDLILNQSVKEAVNDYLTDPEARLIKKAKDEVDRPKKIFLTPKRQGDQSLLDTWEEHLTNCERTGSTEPLRDMHQSMITAISESYGDSRALEAKRDQGEISGATYNHIVRQKTELLEHMNTLKSHFAAALTANQTLTEVDVSEGPLRNMQETLNALLQTDFPSRDISSIESKLTNLASWLQDIRQQRPQSDALTRLIQHFERAHTCSQEILTLIKTQEQTREALTSIRDLTTQLHREKQTSLTRNRLARTLSDGTSRLKNELIRTIQTLTGQFDTSHLEGLVNSLYNAQTEAELAPAEQIATYLGRIEIERTRSINTMLLNLGTMGRETLGQARDYLTTLEQRQAQSTQGRRGSIQECRNALAALRQALTSLTYPPMLTGTVVDTGAQSGFNGFIRNIIFKELQKRSTAFTDMVRDPLFYNQAMRHVGMHALVKGLNTPEAYTAMTSV